MSALLLLLNAVVTVGFQEVMYDVSEGNQAVTVCAMLTGQTLRDVEVSFSTLISEQQTAGTNARNED